MEILFGVSIFSLYLCTQKTIRPQVEWIKRQYRYGREYTKQNGLKTQKQG